ncbi:MAG: VanW family protein [bacterium]
MLRRIIRHEPPAWLLITAIIFFISILSLSGLIVAFENNYKDKSYPGVFIGLVSVGGLTEDEVRQKINNQIDKINTEGIEFSYNQKNYKFYPLTISNDADVANNSIDFDVDNMVNGAMSKGRNQNFAQNLLVQMTGLISNVVIEPTYTINNNDVEAFIRQNFAKDFSQSQDAKLKYSNNRFIIEPEKIGDDIDLSNALNSLDKSLLNFENQKITISKIISAPQIKSTDLAENLTLANQYLDLAPIKLTYLKKNWPIDKSELGKWLAFEKHNGLIQITLNASTTENFLKKKINPEIEVKMSEARFDLKNGKATAFSTAKNGLEVNATATRAKIETDFLMNKLTSIEIITKIIESSVSSSTSALDLGLKEVVGTGKSNFSGSSASRRTNIRVGMSYLNGLLIAPGETFSVMKKLGNIDGSKGYLEELVIKGNETKKEYGGGLCQIGTTMFRAALASGLPIVERRSHSYRVAYYEPAGTDATIYDPSPDLKFLNDTGNYLLIQGKMSGNNLSFDFYGTKDGRKIEQTYPRIYNIVKPAPGKLIETLTLPVGQKKCTEKAHNGADASFDYKVTYSGGEIKSKKFSSHYVPWQEVCLIGVSKLSTASSTGNSTGSISTSTNTTNSLATTTKK